MPSQAVDPHPFHSTMMRDHTRIERHALFVVAWPACCGTVVLAVLLWSWIAHGTLYGQSLLAVVLLYGIAGALYGRKRQIDREIAPIKQRIADLERLRDALQRRREEEL